MMFFRKSDTKKEITLADPNEDRYNPALRAFHNVNAETRAQRKTALAFAWTAMILAGVMGFGMISASHQPKLIPYVVMVNQNGQSTQIGQVPQLSQNDPVMTGITQYTLRQFVQSVRGVVYDPGFQLKLINEYVKPFLVQGQEATTLINDFYSKNNPYDIASKQQKTITIDVDTPIPQSPTTYELHWFETTKNLAGDVMGKTEWRGFATIQLHEVRPDQSNLNPLGIYVVNLTWQQIGLTAAQNSTENQQ